MFCYHCQEAKKNIACDTAGICGKKADVSSLQDLLSYTLKGLAFYSAQAQEYDLVTLKTDRFMAKALFAMVTNVNFSPDDFVALIDESIRRRDSIAKKFRAAFQLKNKQEYNQTIPEAASWQYPTTDQKEFVSKGESVGVKADFELLGEDIHGLLECLIYAAKGLGSLAIHNLEIGQEDPELYAFLHQALAYTLKPEHNIDDILAMLNKSGQLGLSAMNQLNKANTETFGEPEPTTVHLDTWDKPGILVSGHDLQDIEDLLAQTADAGIDVYTHAESISAHAYPALKKYFNLVANFGGAWQDQKTQFAKFNGPVLVTTNSIQQPKKTYQEKIFSTGMVGWPGVTHIPDRKPGERKDFSEIIELAKQSEAPTALTEGQFTTGYGYQALRELSDKIIECLNSGAIKKLIVLVGTDGRHKERNYYQKLATTLSSDTLIFTAGDCKFRFMQHDFGDINGIPRLLDAGQSNDYCVIIRFLQDLAKQMGLSDMNQLPVSFELSWFEQKTILMMLALFSLNVKQLRIGPTLPPFFSENILTLLKDKYGLIGIDDVENDIAAIMDAS